MIRSVGERAKEPNLCWAWLSARLISPHDPKATQVRPLITPLLLGYRPLHFAITSVLPQESWYPRLPRLTVAKSSCWSPSGLRLNRLSFNLTSLKAS